MMRELLISSLEKIRENTYRGPVKRAIVALGMESMLKTLYSVLLSTASNEEYILHEVAGSKASFRISTGMEVQRFRQLMDEKTIVESVVSDLSEDDIFYDVGANVGLYTCFAAQKSNITVAFEPHPKNAERLRENIAFNHLTNVKVREEALSDTEGTAKLAVTGTSVAGEGTHALATGSERKTVDICVAIADNLPQDVPAPDVVKIDVEGAEMSVLRGMKETLSSCRVVYCETHAEKLSDRGESHEAVVITFLDAGFSVEMIESRGEETFLRAENLTLCV